jgi:hypothetical protein
MHKSDSKDEKKAHRKVYKIINENGGWACWSMILQEVCLCESKSDARKIEQKFYDELNENAMNTYRPLRTSEELKEYHAEYNNQYNIDNKITLKERHKQYNIDNKNVIKEQQKQYNIDNKVTIKEYQKQYKIANKETILTHKSERIHCEVCQCYHNRSNISQHIKTNKHLINSMKF